MDNANATHDDFDVIFDTPVVEEVKKTKDTGGSSDKDPYDFLFDDPDLVIEGGKPDEADTSDEDDGEDIDHDEEEASDDDDEADSEDDGEDEDQESEEVSFDDEEFEITVNGETLVVKGSELKNGYMRQSDYSRKTAELSEQRKQLDTEAKSVKDSARIFGYAADQKVAEFDKAIEEAGGWLGMEARYDPASVEQFKAMYQAAKNEQSLAKEFTAKYQKEQEANFQGNMQKVAIHLLETFPNVTQETFVKLDDYMNNQGYDKEMAKSIQDPISWSLIYKAMLYDEAQARVKNKPETKAKEAPVRRVSNTRKETVTDKNTRKLSKLSSVAHNPKASKADKAAALDGLADYFL